VGYVLSDGCIGVYFNDSTKLVRTVDNRHFEYVTRRTQEKAEARSTHSFDDYPDELKKKVTLLRHFESYMLTDTFEKKDGATLGVSSLPPPPCAAVPGNEGEQMVFVKKFSKHKHAMMFQLSNKAVQTVFFDRTEIVLSSKSHLVTYVDKKGEMSSYPLAEVSSPEIVKRLRYTREILALRDGGVGPDTNPTTSASARASSTSARASYDMR